MYKSYHDSSAFLVELPERKIACIKPESPNETGPLMALITISQKLIKVIKYI